MDRTKARNAAGAALIVAAIWWSPDPFQFSTASAPACGGIRTAAIDLCLSLDLGIASAVLRAAL